MKTAYLILLAAVACGVCFAQNAASGTASPGSGFTAAGPAAKTRTVASKLQDFVNVRDYGAVCDGGLTDDRQAIQAAIDAVGTGTLYFPLPGCGVSYPGVYLYPANTGMTLHGQTQLQAGYYTSPASPGGGLVAYSATAPAPVAISGCSAAARLVTCHTASPHGLETGARVTVTGVINAAPAVYCATCSGRNDAVSGGAYTGLVNKIPVNAVYAVTISSTGTPDRFTWTLNGGPPSPPTAITGSSQELSNGVTIRFASTTGHTAGDYWTISPSQYNLPDGVVVSVGSPTQFSYYALEAPAAYASGGTVKKSWSLLTVYANSTDLDHLYLNGNSKTGLAGSGAATHGLVDSMGTNMEWNGVTTQLFSGDGAQVFDEYTPVTTLAADARKGASSVTVKALTMNRITFGAYYCTGMVIDYGQPTEEDLGIGAISGNTISIASGGTLARDHNAATSTVQCHGNADNLQSYHYASYANGGWGFAIVPGTDNNGFHWYDHNSNNNVLGGELWFGTVHLHYGSDYNGDNGPPVQLGDIYHSTGTMFSVFFPLGGNEEGPNGVRAVVATCDGSSIVYFNAAASFSLPTGPQACSTYSRHGSTTVGIGPNGAQAQMEVINALGAMQIQPVGAGPTGSVKNGLSFWDQSLTSMFAQLIPSAVTGNGLSSRKDVTDCTRNGQLEASGFSDPSKMLLLGVDTAHGTTCIQGTHYGTSTYPLKLNPGGGAVGTGAGGFTSFGGTSLYTAPNLIASQTGANNALVATLNDSFGNAVPLAAGLRITLMLSAYSLQAGPDTLNLNGSGALPIMSATNPSKTIATPVAVGGAVDLVYQRGRWLLIGQ